jgi:hypothetical protein
MRANMKQQGTALYFGLEVQVLVQMDHCSLVCFQSHEFIVESADLTFISVLRKAA